MTSISGQSRPVQQIPEPARFWIAYAPRNWRSAGGLWTDLANARIAGFHGTQGAPMPELDAAGLDDLFYLPPVVPELAGERDRLATALVGAGTPVLLELLPGETSRAAGALVIYDLLEALLEGEIDRLSDLPRGATAVWPLIGGLTDRPDAWDEGCSLLKLAGVRCVQAMLLELKPPIRRRLAEGRDDEVFDALFLGDPPSERDFAAFAELHGLESFMQRPLTGYSPRQIRNRRIAAHLALAGETWLRLGKPVSVGQALFRAARGAEHTHHDLAALVQEDNLTVMNWLDALGAEVVEEIVRSGRSALLASLMEEYLGRREPAPVPVPEPDAEPP